MAEDGWMDARFIGGPWDGEEHPIPDWYEPGKVFKLPDRAAMANAGTPADPSVLTPVHGYRLERDEAGFVGRFDPTAE
jgi:hypothetical protein